MLIEQDGPNWRDQLPEIPLVPLSAQQHRQEKPHSAKLNEARAAQKEGQPCYLFTLAHSETV